MTTAIETALTELSANLRRMEQRHQAAGYKFDRLYGLIDAAREELATLTAPAGSADVPNEELLNALCDLSFACFDGFGTKAPSVEVYNRTFSVLKRNREK